MNLFDFKPGKLYFSYQATGSWTLWSKGSEDQRFIEIPKQTPVMHIEPGDLPDVAQRFLFRDKAVWINESYMKYMYEAGREDVS